MAADDAGPLERAWMCCGFRVLERDYFAQPKVFENMDEDRVTVLVLPRSWATLPGLREIAFGYGIGHLFCQRYGLLMLIRGILAWPQLVEGMAERDRETAAD